MLKIEMARCYGHMDHSGVLNNIITDVEMHYNNMVEVITKLEEKVNKKTELSIRIEDFYKQIAELKEENKMLWEENRKLKGGSMLSRIVCDIATIIEHSDADSFTESIAKNLLNYINGGGR